MIKAITEITLLLILSWSISQLWDMPREFLEMWKEVSSWKVQ